MNILIVDDSVAMRMMVKRTLRQAGFTGHDISEAEDGAKALEMIRDATPDVVLADWNMPNMNGIELLEQLNEEGITCKFGFVTTETTGEIRSRASNAGAKFMIAKPFTPEAFEKALGGILD